jgi:hypothetical protein
MSVPSDDQLKLMSVPSDDQLEQWCVITDDQLKQIAAPTDDQFRNWGLLLYTYRRPTETQSCFYRHQLEH